MIVEVVFQDGDVAQVDAESIKETPWALIIYRKNGKRSVIPLTNNVKEYEVDEQEV